MESMESHWKSIEIHLKFKSMRIQVKIKWILIIYMEINWIYGNHVQNHELHWNSIENQMNMEICGNPLDYNGNQVKPIETRMQSMEIP